MKSHDTPLPTNRTRRNDPDRRQRIIDACLQVIAEKGVAGTTHRAVAAVAGVPLGSMTYHFSGIDDLIHQAFDQFMHQAAQRFRERMEHARNQQDAAAALVDYIVGDMLGTQRDMAINLELYAAAAHNALYRDINDEWMAQTRASLSLHFDARTAQVLDAAAEGLSIQRALSCEPPSAEETRAEAFEMISRLLGDESAERPIPPAQSDGNN